MSQQGDAAATLHAAVNKVMDVVAMLSEAAVRYDEVQGLVQQALGGTSDVSEVAGMTAQLQQQLETVFQGTLNLGTVIEGLANARS